MKYIKKIIIDNFQSHEHSELDFELGLNIIVGQSDKGKSAVLRALKWVLYNEPRGTDFIRYGASECAVTLITGDNYTVTRRRKSNKNIYIVIKPDGKKLEFENFGNAVPVEVIEATGVKVIKLDTDTEAKLNMNEQLDAPFLLSETGTMRAKAIGRIVNTNIIDAAERDIQKDISNNNLVIKGLERQLADTETELEQYKDIDEQEKNLQKIDVFLSKLIEVDSKSHKLKELQSKICSINQAVADNKKVLEGLKYLPSISDYFSDLKEKYTSTQRLCGYRDKLKSIDSSIAQDRDCLEKVKHLDKIEDHVRTIDVKCKLCTKLTELNAKYKDVESKLATGKAYTASVRKELKDKASLYSQKLKHLGKCPTCYSLISDATLNQIISEMEGEINVGN